MLLYQFEISPFCDKVRRVLAYKGLAFKIHEIRFAELGRLRKTVSPTGKFPALDHNGRIIVDSSDIVRYLDEAFPQKPVIPADPRDRALAHLLEDWADESLYFYEMTMRFTWPENAKVWAPELLKAESGFLKRFGPRMVQGQLKKTVTTQGIGRKDKAQILKEVGAHLDALSVLLGPREFLAGLSLSVADIAVFAQLFCIRGAPEGAALIAARPAMAAFMDRIEALTTPRA